MKLFRGIESIAGFGATTIAVGSFDGLHCGHALLLKTLRSRAKANGSKSVVVSFSPHPRVALSRAEGLQLLTSEEEKVELLNDQGIDALLIIEFNEEFSRLSYQDFLIDYLVKQAGMAELVVGFNNHMGHDSGGYAKLKEVAKDNNFEITLAEELLKSGETISSTLIRNLLSSGKIRKANKLLSHPYLMIGQSDEAGEVKFSEPLKLTPQAGVYKAEVNGEKQIIVIDEQKRVWCLQREALVKIKVKRKL